jgi:sugar lactone lactonase YvrE
LYRINDLVVIDEDKFYYTNCFYHSDNTSVMIEFILMLPWGYIGYFNGKVGRIVTRGLFYPNGINVSKDRK